MKKQKHYCPDCGGAQVNHNVAYISILLSSLIDPWTNWLGKIIPDSSFDWLGPIVTKTLTFLKLGKITYEPKDDDSGRTRVLWEEATKRGIKMYEFRLFGVGHDIFVSDYKGDKRFFDVLPRPKIYNGKGLEWMDNKGKMKEYFEKAEIKVARGGVTHFVKKALKIFHSLDKPVITKPNLGSRSRHTTTHISDEKEFIIAFKKARQLSPWVMIEEELSGYVFRGTLIGGKLIAVLRREPAYVIGDGIHNVKELIDIENKNPLRNGKIFHQLSLDNEAIKELIHWNRNEDTIPKKDEIITLGQKTSRVVGGGITDMTDIVHFDNKIMLEKVAEVLDDPLIGVDFIMDDVSVSWRDQPKCGVIECNSAPFIDLHHFPLVGQPHNVASALWDIIYPESKIL
jgi:D-alanine-D-alanine ligase-like ATP-grasp enzyme